MELRINDTPIERINYPGIADTMIKLVTLPLESRQKGGEQIGWIPDENTFGSEETNTGRVKRRKIYNTYGRGNIYIGIYHLSLVLQNIQKFFKKFHSA